MLLVLCGACSRTYLPTAPPLTCEWIHVEVDPGHPTTPDAPTVDDVVAWMEDHTVPIRTALGHGTLHLRLRPSQSELRIHRRLPPNREVLTAVPGVPCAEGDLLRIPANVTATILLDDGTELVDRDYFGVAEVGELSADGVHVDVRRGWVDWRDLGEWTELVEDARPARRRRLAIVPGIAGSYADGAVHIDVVTRDAWGDEIDRAVALRSEW
jgi:hypothetical protein